MYSLMQGLIFPYLLAILLGLGDDLILIALFLWVHHIQVFLSPVECTLLEQIQHDHIWHYHCLGVSECVCVCVWDYMNCVHKNIMLHTVWNWNSQKKICWNVRFTFLWGFWGQKCQTLQYSNHGNIKGFMHHFVNELVPASSRKPDWNSILQDCVSMIMGSSCMNYVYWPKEAQCALIIIYGHLHSDFTGICNQNS